MKFGNKLLTLTSIDEGGNGLSFQSKRGKSTWITVTIKWIRISKIWPLNSRVSFRCNCNGNSSIQCNCCRKMIQYFQWIGDNLMEIWWLGLQSVCHSLKLCDPPVWMFGRFTSSCASSVAIVDVSEQGNNAHTHTHKYEPSASFV